MTTYQTPKKSESSTVEAIPEDEFAYYSRRLQNRVFGAMVNAFADEVRAGHISRAKLAKKINKSPEQITRWLSQPSNMKLDTISRIYCGLGAEMKDPSAAFFRDAVRPNYAHPLVRELAHPQQELDQKHRIEIKYFDDRKQEQVSSTSNHDDRILFFLNPNNALQTR